MAKTSVKNYGHLPMNVFIIQATGLHEEVDRECKDFQLIMVFLQSK